MSEKLSDAMGRVLGVLDEARLLREHKEEGAAGYFLRKFEHDAADLLRQHGDAIAAVLRAVEGAAVTPITTMTEPPPHGRIPEWNDPCFTTTYAKIILCDEAGALVPLDAAGSAEGVEGG